MSWLWVLALLTVGGISPQSQEAVPSTGVVTGIRRQTVRKVSVFNFRVESTKTYGVGHSGWLVHNTSSLDDLEEMVNPYGVGKTEIKTLRRKLENLPAKGQNRFDRYGHRVLKEQDRIMGLFLREYRAGEITQSRLREAVVDRIYQTLAELGSALDKMSRKYFRRN